MKKLAVVLALSSSAVFAQDLQLGDLNFFQKDGSVQWNTEVAMGKSEFTSKNSVTVDTSDHESKSTTWSNAVTYGLSDKFNLGLAFSYDLKDEMKNTKKSDGSPKVKAYDQDGLSDFTILGNYRLMDQAVYVDVNAGLTLGLGDAEVGDSDNVKAKDGNNKQGYHDLNLGVAAGQKIDKFEWRAGLALNYNFAGEVTELTVDPAKTKKTVDTDGSLDYGLNAALQYRVMPKLTLGLGLSWMNLADKESDFKEDDGTKTKRTTDSISVLGVSLDAKYNLSDSMLLTAGYRFTNTYDIDVEVENSGTTVKGTAEDTKNSAVFVGASFLF